MKLSIFVTATDPIRRQDPFYEAVNSYNDLADEVIVVDGSNGPTLSAIDWSGTRVKVIRHTWPEKFDWPFIGQQFQRGYEACTGDWVIHCDCDYFFHEDDIPKIRALLSTQPDQIAFSFYKYQFLLVDRYNIKSRTVLAVNRKKYGDRIRFDSGGDLCQPSLDGKELKAEENPQAGIPFYNYDFCFKELDVINKDWIRFRDAWKRHFGTDFGTFKAMMMGRFKGRSWEKISLDRHPKYIQQRIKNIKPNQFGYNMFDWIKEKIDYPLAGKKLGGQATYRHTIN